MLKVTVLIDNDSMQKDLKTEKGLSLHIEADDISILFDTGKSGGLIENAQSLGVNLLKVNRIVLSHGHYDHTGGLPSLIEFYKRQKLIKYPPIVCHPDAFCKRANLLGLYQLGSPLREQEIVENFSVQFTKDPLWINKQFVFLGEIPRNKELDTEDCFGSIEKKGLISDDRILDDSALVYKSPKGLIIFTGCSHSGICNIVEYARMICEENRILDIIGGFHLRSAGKERLSKVSMYMIKAAPTTLHACHCTGNGRKALPKQENIGVGKKLMYSFEELSSTLFAQAHSKLEDVKIEKESIIPPLSTP